jgi:hypothetical protein
MNYQLGRTLQETHTTLAPAEVLTAAKRFFARRQGIYAAFLEKEGPTFVNLRGQGGEELIVGVLPAEHGTRVTASTYIFDQQVGRFFATLPPYPAEDPAAAPHEAGGRATPEAPGQATPGGPT